MLTLPDNEIKMIQQNHTSDMEELTMMSRFKDQCEGFDLQDTITVNHHWQSFSHPNKTVKFVLMGAYFDQRRIDDSKAHNILITGVSNVDLTYSSPTRKVERYEVHCYAWYEGCTSPITTQVQINRLDKWVFQINGDRRYQLSIKCKHPTGLYFNNSQTPTHVSLTFVPCMSYVKVKLKYPIRENYTNVYGICVPPLYGKLDSREALALTEWMEMNLMYGIKEINFYDVKLTPDEHLKIIFQYYRSKGVVSVQSFPPPVETVTGSNEYEVSQMAVRATINDCIVMNSFRYKYAIILDIDEMLVPYGFKDYNSMFHHTEKITYRANVSSAFLFHSLDFFLDFKPQREVNNNDHIALISSQYTKYSYKYGKSKPAINPRFCALAHNHGCLFDSQTISTGDKRVPITVASIHHYRRNCSHGYNTDGARVKQMNRQADCKERLSGAAESNKELFYRREELYHRVTEALKEMGLDKENLLHY